MKIRKFSFFACIAVLLFTALIFGGCGGDTDDNTNDEDEVENPDDQNNPLSLEGKLLILQAYGAGDASDGAVSHSFVELYNTTENAIDLTGICLWYADGTRPAAAGDPAAEKDGNWSSIALSGTIPAGASYLITGIKMNVSGRLQLADNYADKNDASFSLSNRSFKVALIKGTTQLTDAIQNPFNTDGAGKKAAGYIDMVGAMNDPAHARPDQILGYEGTFDIQEGKYLRISKQEAVRRISLTDTDKNADDFENIRYQLNGAANEVKEWALDFYRPKNSAYGKWNPMNKPSAPVTPPEEPPAVEETASLMILQANTYGNDNGGGGGFARSLVELYNNTETDINLGTDNYYLHIGGTAWTNVIIKLEGIIPAKSSFLIVDNTPESTANTNATPRAVLPSADQQAEFVLINNDFVAALIIGRSSPLTGNPFTDNGGAPIEGYVDMLGCRNAIAKEGTAASTSRPQAPRRTSLADTNNNGVDFAQVDYRGILTGTNGMPDSELYKYWPRNSAAGAWNPMTGLPKANPAVSD